MRSSGPLSMRAGGLAISFVVLSVALYSMSFTVADPDLWGHLRFGLDILDSGRVIQVDRYSYLSSAHPWFNHEWLADVIFALTFRAAGGPGLVLLKAALSMVVLGGLYLALRQGELEPVRAGIVFLVALPLCVFGMNTVRPQLFTYLGFFSVLAVIRSAGHGRRHWLAAVPLVIAIWTNLHGGFLAGLVVFLTWAGVRCASTLLKERRVDGLVMGSALGALVAPILNPYGVALPLFLLRTATVQRPEIGEWNPLPIASVEGLFYLGMLVLVGLGLGASRRPRDFAVLAVVSGMALSPLIAIRHLPLFGLTVPLLLAEDLSDAWNRLLPSSGEVESSRLAWLPAGLATACALTLSLLAVPRLVSLQPTSGLFYPARAVALLKDAGVSGNLVVHFDWGDYVIWNLGPKVRVSLDGRRETVYSEAVYAENARWREGVGAWDTILRRPSTDMALASKRWPTFNLMKMLAPEWKLLYEDAMVGLFARAGSESARRLSLASPRDLPEDGEGLGFEIGPAGATCRPPVTVGCL